MLVIRKKQMAVLAESALHSFEQRVLLGALRNVIALQIPDDPTAQLIGHRVLHLLGDRQLVIVSEKLVGRENACVEAQVGDLGEAVPLIARRADLIHQHVVVDLFQRRRDRDGLARSGHSACP